MAENLNINPNEDPVYRKKIYKFLTDNFDDFKVSEQDFYKKLDTDQAYAPKVYKVIKDNFSDFDRGEQDFMFLMTPSKKKDQAVSGQPSVVSGSTSPSESKFQLPAVDPSKEPEDNLYDLNQAVTKEAENVYSQSQAKIQSLSKDYEDYVAQLNQQLKEGVIDNFTAKGLLGHKKRRVDGEIEVVNAAYQQAIEQLNDNTKEERKKILNPKNRKTSVEVGVTSSEGENATLLNEIYDLTKELDGLEDGSKDKERISQALKQKKTQLSGRLGIPEEGLEPAIAGQIYSNTIGKAPNPQEIREYEVGIKDAPVNTSTTQQRRKSGQLLYENLYDYYQKNPKAASNVFSQTFMDLPDETGARKPSQYDFEMVDFMIKNGKEAVRDEQGVLYVPEGAKDVDVKTLQSQYVRNLKGLSQQTTENFIKLTPSSDDRDKLESGAMSQEAFDKKYNYENITKNLQKQLDLVNQYVLDDKDKSQISKYVKDSYTYIADVTGRFGGKEYREKNPLYAGLNDYQKIYLESLRISDPETYENRLRLLTTPLELVKQETGTWNPKLQMGYEKMMKDAEDDGIKFSALDYLSRIENLVSQDKRGELDAEGKLELTELIAQYDELQKFKNSQIDRYPVAAKQEIIDNIGRATGDTELGIGGQFVYGTGNVISIGVNWLYELVTYPFSDEDSRISNLETIGNEALYKSKMNRGWEDESAVEGAYQYAVDPEFKKQVDAIDADAKLNQQQKYDAKVVAFEKYRKDKGESPIVVTKNPNAGDVNLSATAILNTTSDVAQQILGQIALSAATGGMGNVSKIRSLATLFGTTFATTIDRYEAEALLEGRTNATSYAIRKATIDALTELYGDDLMQVKNLFKGKGAVGKIINSVTEAEWKAVLSARKGIFNKVKNVIGQLPKRVLKPAATETLEEGTAQLLNQAFDGKDLFEGMKETLVTTAVGTGGAFLIGLPFSFRSINNSQKVKLYNAGANADKYIASVKSQLESGQIDAKEAQKRELVINDIKGIVDNMAKVDENGKPLSDQNLIDLAFNKYVELQAQKAKKENPKSTKLDQVIDELQDENAQILSGEAQVVVFPEEDVEAGEITPEATKPTEDEPEVPQPEQQKESIAKAVKEAGYDVTPEQLDRIYDGVIKGNGKIDANEVRRILNAGYIGANTAAEYINELGIRAGEVAPEVPATEITEQEYNDFIDKGIVTPERLNDIAQKVKGQEKLSEREQEIFTDKTADINKIIAGEVAPEVPQPTKAGSVGVGGVPAAEKVEQLRAAEQAEYAAMADPKDKAKRKEIYDRYDKLITPLLEKEKEVSAEAPAPSIIEVKSPKEVKQGDTVVWRGEDFTVEEVNAKGGFNLQNNKDRTWTVKDARITDEEFQGKRGEVAAAPAVQKFGVGFAPFREKNVFTEEEDVDIRTSPDYQLHQENVQKVAEGLGIKINNKLDTWGGYVDSETGNPVQEVSNIMEIEATPEQARVMAAILGKAAPEMQDSVLLGNYNEQGAGLEHIVKTGSFANAKEAIKLLKDNGLQYFSVDKNSGDVIILDLDATDTPKIVNLVKQLNENGIPAKHKYGKVNAEFIGSGDYDGIIEAERGRIGAETGFDIDAFVQEAAGKYDAIKAARTEPVVPQPLPAKLTIVPREVQEPIVRRISKSVQRIFGKKESQIATLTGKEWEDALAAAKEGQDVNFQSWGAFEKTGFEETPEYKKLLAEGKIREAFAIKNIAGKPVVVINPDNMMTGVIISKDGKPIINGNGGINFVSKFGDVWASSDQSTATTLAKYINEARELDLKNGGDGVVHIVVTKGTLAKSLTSHTGAKGAMAVLENLVDKGLIGLKDFRKALTDVGKKYGIDFDGRADAKSIHSDIASKFFGVDDSSFSRRGTFIEDVINHLAENSESVHNNIEGIREALNSKELISEETGKPRKINFARAGVIDALGLLFSDNMTKGVPSSHAYATIEVSKPVKVEKGEHESYPFHIRQEDGSRPTLNILSDKRHVTEIVNDKNNAPVLKNIPKVDAEGNPIVNKNGIQLTESGAGKLGSNQIGMAKGFIKSEAEIPKDDVKYMTDSKGNVYGFEKGGNIFLNGDYVSPNTPIHEAGHIWTNWAEQNRGDLFNAGLSKIEGSRYLKDVQSNPFYQEQASKLPESQRQEYFRKEALAKAIGDNGEKFVTEAKKNDFKQWILNLWRNVIREFGIRDMSAEQLSKLTIDEFSKKVAADIFGGKAEKVKTQEYAVQEQAAGEVPVQPKARVSEEVEGGVPPTRPEEITKEGEVEGEEGEVKIKPSGIKKGLVSQEVLAKMNLEKVGDKELLESGRKIIDSGEVNPPSLVNKILDEGKGVLTPAEVVALITYKADLDNKQEALAKEIAKREESGKDLGTLLADMKTLQTEIDNFDMAAVITAQQQSMSFRLRRYMLDRSYNITVQIEKYKRANNGVIPAEIEKKFREMDAKIKELNKKLTEAEAQKYEQEGKAAMENIVEDVQREQKNGPALYTEAELEEKIQKGVQAEIEKIYTAMPTPKRSAAQRAITALENIQKKLRSKTYDASLGIPVAVIDAGITAIKNAIKLGIEVEKAVEIGIKTIKDKLKGKQWAKENDFRKDMIDGFKAEGVSLKAKKTEPKINDDGTVTIPNQLIRDLVAKGITDIDDLADAVRKIVEPKLPGVTNRQIRDYITGYGKQVNPTRDDITTKMNTAKRVGRLLSQLEDFQKMGAAAYMLKYRTQKPSGNKLTQKEQELRKLIKQLEKDAIGEDEALGKIQEQKDLDTAKARIRRRIDELSGKIARKDFSPKAKKQVPADQELRDLQSEKEKVKEQFDNAQYEAEQKNKSLGRKINDALNELLVGLARTLVTGFDFGVVFTQGIMKVFTNPITSAKAFAEGMRQFASESRQKKFENDLRASGAYELIKNSGLAVSVGDERASVQEQIFIANYVNLLWNGLATIVTFNHKPSKEFVKALNPFKASQRFMDAYLNYIRINTFLDISSSISKDGYPPEVDPELHKSAAEWVNTTTMKGAKNIPRSLGFLMFSASKVAAELKLFSPYVFVYYYQMPGPIRKRALLNFGKFALSFLAVTSLMRAALGDDDDDEFWDITSSNFLTFKFGDQRVSFAGGIRPMLVFWGRFFSGRYVDQYGEVSKLGERPGKDVNTKGDLVVRFFTSKFAPVPSAVWSKLEERAGREVEDDVLINKLVLPMWLQDSGELYENNPREIGALYTMLSLIGANVRTVETPFKKEQKVSKNITYTDEYSRKRKIELNDEQLKEYQRLFDEIYAKNIEDIKQSFSYKNKKGQEKLVFEAAFSKKAKTDAESDAQKLLEKIYKNEFKKFDIIRETPEEKEVNRILNRGEKKP